ncbi:hypothetical protein EPN29_08320 [bacterium]|nr:MAG: hypothetical protein EPN29_08320 [bacterium]
MTLEDAVAEGRRLVGSAGDREVAMRLLGGVAVAVACQGRVACDELARTYHDIDLAIPRRHSARAVRVLVSEGYRADERFNAQHGDARLLFIDPIRERQVDIFVSEFQMCHRLDLEPGLAAPGFTLPVSDLLLLKLQIVELNRKDVLDSLTLLLHFEMGGADTPLTLNATRIASLCASDWGWHTTVTDNLVQVEKLAPEILSNPHDVRTVHQRLSLLGSKIQDTRKSLGWRIRNRIGRRLQWYDLPDEAAT